MRLRFPGRAAAGASPDPTRDVPDPEQAAVTASPAPTHGRGPRVQAASRTLAIASWRFLLIATVLWPATRFLRNHRWPPALAASTVLIAALALLGGIIAAIAPSVANQ